MAAKKKIAILGGGMASLATAYELTRTPELRAKHEVTIYQNGWRLGGKLASGRTAPDNENFPGAERNVEHGLHVWLGFYENAFMMMRGVFDQLATERGEAFRAWQDAFKGQSFTPIGERYGKDWTYWGVEWPENADIPGSGQVALTPWGAITEVLSAIERLCEGLFSAHAEAPKKSHPIDAWVGGLLAEAVPGSPRVVGGTAKELLGHATKWAKAFEGNHEKFDAKHHEGISRLLELFVGAVADALTADPKHPAVRGIFHVMVMMVAMARGLIDPEAGFLETGNLSKLDRWELREFLKRYTLFKKVIDEADELRAFYDLAFAYENGVYARPNIAAGTAIRCIIRIAVTSKGYVLYLPQGGFGEAVIAPVYRVLVQNGVRFEFFHRVTRLELSGDRSTVAKVHFARQAKTLEDRKYEPMAYLQPSADHGGVWYWPAEPFWSQLENGEALRKAGVDFESKWRQPDETTSRVIEVGRDYDVVVLGIAHGAFMQLNSEPTLADELYAANPAFKQAIHALGIVPTQAIQLWTKPDLKGLGWSGGKPAMVAAPELLDVWADMSQTLAYESWPGREKPGFVAYVCAIYPTTLFREPSTNRAVPDEALRGVREIGLEYYAKYTGWMWPKATRPAEPDALDYGVLVAPGGATGEARFDSQYLRANVEPTECCVSALKGATKYRLDADGSGFDNLYLAGDWTHTVTDTVCVESAVSSGKFASRAISGEPRLVVGEDFLFGAPRERRVAARGVAPSKSMAGAPATETSSLPFYVSFHGCAEQSALPPGKVKDGRCYYFAVPIDPERAQAFVDSKLNAPAGGAVKYHVLGDRLLISFLRADKLYSTGQVTGYVPDRECGLWIPLVATQPGAKHEFRLALWMPYVFINNSAGMCTGREVWGFRKEISTFTIPADPGDATTFVANATLFETFDQDTLGQMRPLVTLQKTRARGITEGTWKDSEAAFEAIIHGITEGEGKLDVHGLEEDAELSLEVAELVTEANVPVVNLKQFRDAVDPTRACYQALVESPIHLDALRGGWFLSGDYELAVTPCASHKIAEDLGLASNVVPVSFAFWIDFDFSALAGSIVWQAG